MLRLSCPHLVKAIDELEADGGIDDINAILQSQSSETGQKYCESFSESNTAWRAIRKVLCSPDDLRAAEKVLGIEGCASMMNSGLIGVTMDKVNDAKCLHAHTADYFLRGGTNLIGKSVLETLQLKGIEPGGCENCWQQCDINVDKKSAQWWYMSVKNKEKLRQARDRRRIRKTTESNIRDDQAE